MRAQSRALPRVVAGVLAVIVLVLPWQSPGQALPGDPPVTPLSPGNGAVVPADVAGIPISYACPRYGDYVFGQTTVTAGSESYTAGVSTSPAVAADGRLASPFKTVGGPFGDPGTCQSSLGSSTDLADVRPQQVPGTYYWQVWRACADCVNGYEVGPVWSFTVRLDTTLRVVSPAKAYAGVPTLVVVAAEGTQGNLVTLQRKAGTKWKKVGSAPISGQGDVKAGHVAVIATLPAGKQKVRARVVVQGSTVVSKARTVTVRRPVGYRAGTVGMYRDRDHDGLRFTVTAGGRTLRGFTTHVAATCTSPFGTTSVEDRILTLPPVRLAPDGRFVIYRRAQGQDGWLQGRLRQDTVSGYASFQGGSCRGDLHFKAARTG